MAIGLGIVAHGAEFVEGEGFAAAAYAFLFEDHRASVGDEYHQTERQNDW
jgi:hypothetical protein